MTSIVPIQCLACRRLVKVRATCDAFPEGIPEGMLSGGDHRAPIQGDGGKLFLQRDDSIGRLAFSQWDRVFG